MRGDVADERGQRMKFMAKVASLNASETLKDAFLAFDRSEENAADREALFGLKRRRSTPTSCSC